MPELQNCWKERLIRFIKFDGYWQVSLTHVDILQFLFKIDKK